MNWLQIYALGIPLTLLVLAGLRWRALHPKPASELEAAFALLDGPESSFRALVRKWPQGIGLALLWPLVLALAILVLIVLVLVVLHDRLTVR